MPVELSPYPSIADSPPGWCGSSSVRSWPAARGLSRVEYGTQTATRRPGGLPEVLDQTGRRLGHADNRKAWRL